MLPTKLVMLNMNFNRLRTQGVKANAFKVSSFQTQNFQGFYSPIPNNAWMWPRLSETCKTSLPLPWTQWSDSSAPTARVSSRCAPACEPPYLSLQSALLFPFKLMKAQMGKPWCFLLVLSVLQNNKISSITDHTFCQGNSSYYIRTNMDQVRLDGNPVKLWEYPNSFICLHSLPVGWYNWNDSSTFYTGLNTGVGLGSGIELDLYDNKVENESQKHHLE